MRASIRRAVMAAAGIGALVGAGGVADAATHHKKHATRHHARKHQAASTTTSSGSATPTRPANAETPLTGDTKTKAEAAAQAAIPDGKIWRSSTEDPSDASGAAYEVHVTKADGSEVEVLEDASFTVIATEASKQGAGDHAGPGGPGHGHGAPLTGDTKTSAESAALAAVPGGTVRCSSAADADDDTSAAYEVHVTKSDGSEVVVLEDKDFKVLSTEAAPPHPQGGPQGGGPQDGRGGPPRGGPQGSQQVPPDQG